MDEKILEFVTLLRKAGVKVSQTEVVECLKALALVGMDREDFFNCMAATMIKDHGDFRIFQKLFYYYFDPNFFGHREDALRRWPNLVNFSDTAGCTGADSLPGLEGVNEEAVPGAEKGRSTGFGQGQGLSTAVADSFVQIIKAGSPGDMAEMVKRGVESLGRLSKDDLVEMKEAVRQVKVFLEWNMGVYRLENDSSQADESVWLTWQEKLAEAEDLLYRELEKALISELGQEALETILIRENLNELDFYSLSAPQVTEIKKRISKLAHKLATRLSFRQKRARRGRMDLQKTIRRSMATGGVPVSPAFRNRYPTRPEIVVLCDLSGSVRVFSEFMLQLVYSIQNRFIHVRSFVFVDTPDEITDYMQNHAIEDGVRDVYNKARFSKTAFSDYGQMYIDFCSRYFDVLNKKVTLLVIGDARNNYQKEHADFFAKMCREVKKVIWLNPEPAEKWDQEDSVMSVYGSSCSQVFECRNLQQLDSVARRII